MKPVQTLLFILLVFVLLAGAMWLTPKAGVKVGAFTFHMPGMKEMLLKNEVQYADLSKIIDHQFEIDSLLEFELQTLAGDTIAELVHKANYDSLVQSINKLEMNLAGRENLNRFFYHLQNDSLTRIMHYGDSQLEGDRISSFVRNKLQLRFGGTGIGLRPALQPYDYVFSAIQKNSSNWVRYPIYGKVDSTITHRRYGVMGAFSRYAPPLPDSVPFPDSTFYEAELTISKTDISFLKTRQYDQLTIYYGNSRSPVQVMIFVKGDTLFSANLTANIDYGKLKFDLPDSTSSVSLQFSGFDSPDIYGIELASTTGVIVDNIALRGSSGTIFTRADYDHSLKMYRGLNPALFILQFGGNAMPYIQNNTAIKRYSRWFASQIQRLQHLCPEAAIIVIGPGDMSEKQKDKYVTYKHLPDVVEALQKVAQENGCAYWNMYTAMGGHNSMPSWVNADPELARPDYVHFSPKGARLIANMFYNALIYEYNNYLEEDK